MVFTSILLGLVWQVFFHRSIVWDASQLWRWYLQQCERQHWVVVRGATLQYGLMCTLMCFFYAVIWVLLSDFLWGFGAFLIYLSFFMLSCTGYTRMIEMDILRSHLSCGDEVLASTFMRDHFYIEDAPNSESLQVQAMKLLIGPVWRELFTPLFWFFCLGPMGGLVAVLTAYLSVSGDARPSLKSQAQGFLYVLAWVPVRLMALVLFLVARQEPVPFEQFWSYAKLARVEHDVFLQTILLLAWGFEFDERLGEKAFVEVPWRVEYINRLYSAVRKTLLVWLGVLAVLTVVL